MTSKKQHKARDLTGTRFGLLTVGGFFGRSQGFRQEVTWACVCDCGGSAVVRGSLLRRGHTKSCGCLVNPPEKCHRMVGTLEYKSWSGMWDRCTNPRSKSYEAYKGRKPPEAWRDFRVFLRDVGHSPSPLHSLDRTDNDKPYGPSNVRWATSAEQRRNSCRVTLVKYLEDIMCLTDACKAAGLSRGTINQRIRAGQTMEQASNNLLTLVKRST